jgi:hypothetical protein
MIVMHWNDPAWTAGSARRPMHTVRNVDGLRQTIRRHVDGMRILESLLANSFARLEPHSEQFNSRTKNDWLAATGVAMERNHCAHVGRCTRTLVAKLNPKDIDIEKPPVLVLVLSGPYACARESDVGRC